MTSRFLASIVVLACPLAMPVLAQTPAELLADAPQPQPSVYAATTGPGALPPASDDTGPADSDVSVRASIMGTVTDTNGGIVPGAQVTLDGPRSSDHHESVADDNAAFSFEGLKPGIPYRVTVTTPGFVTWSSPQSVILSPGQHYILTGVQLTLRGADTSVEVYASQEQLAIEQVHAEMEQRVLGFIPNFYVVYDSKNAVAMTSKLKFKLAMRVSVDPITIGAVGAMSGINQASDRLAYGQGAKGYGKRFGAEAAMGFSDILFGGAVFPVLLHQDPRYFYQGTGTTRSRLRHALFSPFICRGDNGRSQINYSSLGGDLVSSALANAYYPDSDRGAGMTLGTFAIGTTERMLSGIAQEFILPRLTSHRKNAE